MDPPKVSVSHLEATLVLSQSIIFPVEIQLPHGNLMFNLSSVPVVATK